ncbi:hypothetical protein FH968_10705 [Buttiauxella sp. B2]|uniref:hypothetical protein n=1 Tax=Buttiauxella sp. B2 TaxID=2587812 RepID=UPI00111F8717|nr:hypothetical protein [Buttiauxella sp. B2]TNV20465.1 hypothetical protein FH968_10705 [Buttiauxella sp. B2]
MKKSLVYTLVGFTMLVMITLITTWYKTNTANINCQARTVLHDRDNTLNIKTILHMSPGDNFFELFMTFTTPPLLPEKFHRVVNFSYDKDGDVYKMFSDATNDNALPPAVRNSLNDLVPDFYLMPQRGIRIKIDKTKNGNYLILNDRLPVFLCVPIAS